jgi:DNA-binding transcriptional LysR family regulator
MILSNLFPGGVLQLYDVLQNGYWHACSAAFGHSMLMHTLEWARLRRTLQEADGPLAVLAFVAAGLGAALLPEQVKLPVHPGVAFCPLKPVVKVESCIAWKSDNTSKPLGRYVELLKQPAK